jgi:hypothetical protein
MPNKQTASTQAEYAMRVLKLLRLAELNEFHVSLTWYGFELRDAPHEDCLAEFGYECGANSEHELDIAEQEVAAAETLRQERIHRAILREQVLQKLTVEERNLLGL